MIEFECTKSVLTGFYATNKQKIITCTKLTARCKPDERGVKQRVVRIDAGPNDAFLAEVHYSWEKAATLRVPTISGENKDFSIMSNVISNKEDGTWYDLIFLLLNF